jgi:uncharacterized protein YnzC (UPF0291/DUF896 family)
LAQLVRYVWLVTDELHYEQFRAKINELAPQAEQTVMTIAEELRQQGLQQGLRRGQQQVLLKLLRLKFGDVRDEDVARIEQADDASLERSLERVLTADSVAAVLGG